MTTIFERDVQDIANIAKPKDFAKLLSIVASRCSNLLNLSELSRLAGIPHTTLQQYMVILESLFLVVRQPAWHMNRTKRLVKMPKIYYGDTGLLLNQLRMEKEMLLDQGRVLGAVLENFVFLELKKLSNWASQPIDFYHYRTQTGAEVDLILENRAGQIVGIEIKASESISPDDWKGMDVLKNEMGEKMKRGIILYTGKQVVAFGKNRYALPMSSLWDEN